MTSAKNYQLYYFASCPFCIKAIVRLSLMGVKVPMKNIKRHPSHKQALIEGGGKKQVPCLRIASDDGEVQWLYESADIVNYFKQELALN